MQAQSNVYSLNVVGYVNLTLKPGYNLITAQLNATGGSRSINVLLTNAPALADGSTFFAWNAVAQGFTSAANFVGTPPDGPAWYNADYTALATDVAPLGQSYFIKNEGAQTTLTLVGEVPQGAFNQSVPNNYSFLGDFAPTSQEIKTNGFPIADNSILFTYDSTAQGYTSAINGVGTPPDGPAWYNADFTAEVAFAPAVGQGFIYNTTAGAAPWNRNFTVK
jgi:hypothetical protein